MELPCCRVGATAFTLAVCACVSASATPQSGIAEFRVPTTTRGTEMALVPLATRSGETASGTEAEVPGSAIYSPYSNGASVKQQRPSPVSKPRSERAADLTMTLAASAGGILVLVWLLGRL